MKVAVLLATYNRAQKVNGVPMIERSINSFLDQDYKNSDLIILNDCSTDETPQILSKHEMNVTGRIVWVPDLVEQIKKCKL